MKYLKFTKKAVAIYITIIILLIASLAFSAVSIIGIKKQTHDLNSSLAEANTKISQLEQANSEKEEQIKQYEVTVSDLQVAVQSKKESQNTTPSAAAASNASSASSYDPSLSASANEVFAKANHYDGPKTCYLTFDDGPTENTSKILDILKENNIKATFFVIHDNPELLKRIHNEGHTIGLHSASHKYSKIYASEEAFFSDLTEIGDAVERATGVRTKIIRFPGGSSNTVSASYCKGIMSKLTRQVVEKGYLYYDWNASDGDADGSNIPASTLIKNIRRDGTSSKMLIVLVHDAADKKTTVEALPEIIKIYRDAGYAFDRITEQTPMMTHSVNN